MEGDPKYINSGTFAGGTEEQELSARVLETVHCPICMAVPKYCPGHDNDSRYRGTMVPTNQQLNSVTGSKYGRFTGDPICRWVPDGTRMVLLEDFSYVDRSFKEWKATKGSVLDGASIPRPFWTLVGSPFRGMYRYASIIHDYYCVQRDTDWKAVHRMFYEACLCGGCGVVQAKTLFYAVYQFGPRWGHKDIHESRGTSTVDVFDIDKVVQFIEGNPDFRRMIETPPIQIGISRRYGRREDKRSSNYTRGNGDV